ncbi:hypothetical protein [Neosynechococcus sphagnicola]|nr:hypothetical protein [Neosynechococcus sphagnicola]
MAELGELLVSALEDVLKVFQGVFHHPSYLEANTRESGFQGLRSRL